MKVGLAGQGAFGVKHLEAIQNIPGIEVITLTGSRMETAEEVAKKFGIPHWTGDLAESMKQPDLEALKSGFKDAFDGKEPPFAMEDMRAAMTQYSTAMRAQDSPFARPRTKRASEFMRRSVRRRPVLSSWRARK